MPLKKKNPEESMQFTYKEIVSIWHYLMNQTFLVLLQNTTLTQT